MPAQAQMRERAEHKPLPLPNTDFYEVTETLDTEELTLLKQVRAFMKAKVAPVITKHWAEDSFAFELRPAVRRSRAYRWSGDGEGTDLVMGNVGLKASVRPDIIDRVLDYSGKVHPQISGGVGKGLGVPLKTAAA
jgi:hypothetical protein